MRFLGLLLSAIVVEFRAIFGVVTLLGRPFWIAWGLCCLCALVGFLPGVWAIFAQLFVLIGLGLAGLFSGTLAKRVRRRKWVDFPDGPEVAPYLPQFITLLVAPPYFLAMLVLFHQAAAFPGILPTASYLDALLLALDNFVRTKVFFDVAACFHLRFGSPIENPIGRSLVFLSRFLLDLVFIKLAFQLLNAAWFRAQGLGRGQDLLYAVKQEIAAGDVPRVKELSQEVDHLAARKDQRREPVEGNEILLVIQRRVLAKLPKDADSLPAATAYQEIVTQMRRAYAQSAAERQQAEEDGLALRDRVRSSYPFHPAIIDLMRERWAAIPDFQRTRGALRFLASCLRAAHREGKSRAVLGPGDDPIHDSEVRLAFFKEVGQQSDFQAVLEHDLVGANARCRRIDDRRAKENATEGVRRPATRLATAILMYSFGGLRRENAQEGDLLPAGVTESELLSVCVGPDLDSTTALACLKELKEQCLYLHFDGARYCFKKDPNVTLLIEQEAEAVGRNDKQVRARVKEMIEGRLAGHRNAIVWPENAADIPDRDPSFLVAYLPIELGGKPRGQQESVAKDLLEKCGEKPRTFRNGLGLALPAGDQVEILRRAVRYLIAAEGVKGKAKQLNLTDEQRGQLRERESTEQAAAESALLKLYTEVWLPRAEEGGIGIEKIAAGGRPLQTTLNDKKQAMIHERIVELITSVQPRVFTTLAPTKIVELFRLGEGSPPQVGISTGEVVDGFYSFLGFTRLMTSGVNRKAVAKGVQDGHFGYVSGAKPPLGTDGKFQVVPTKVRFKTAVSEDEIDLESGFLMLPQAIPQPAAEMEQPIVVPGGETSVPGSGGVTLPPGMVVPGGSVTPVKPVGDKAVELTFDADRNQLFTAWNAIANLADLAGKVKVTIRAESENGFDKAKLQNGVLEPLREADLIE